MNNEEDSFEDWLQGFGSSPYTSNQLNDIKARSDNVSAVEINHLVKEVELLRHLLRALLEYSQNLEMSSNTELGENKNELFDLARFMLSVRE